MSEAIVRYGITHGQLTVHQDRGSPMTAHNLDTAEEKFRQRQAPPPVGSV